MTSPTARLRTKLSTKMIAKAGLLTKSAVLNQTRLHQLVYGTEANEADLCFTDTRMVLAKGSDVLNLEEGLEDAFGNPLIFATMKVLYVFSHQDNTTSFIVGSAGNRLFGQTRTGTAFALFPGDEFFVNRQRSDWNVILYPGDEFFITKLKSGWPSSGAKSLTVLNDSNTAVNYDVIIFGTSE